MLPPQLRFLLRLGRLALVNIFLEIRRSLAYCIPRLSRLGLPPRGPSCRSDVSTKTFVGLRFCDFLNE